MSTPIRVRFAPSPTGDLHVGGARTALFNYLFARSSGGKFLVRVEDTDRERSTDEATKTILDGLSWLKLEADEELVFQSKRIESHLEAVKKLLATSKAYPCFATPEELEAMREAAQKKGEKPKYDGRFRPADGEEVDCTLPSAKDKKPFVIRLKRPLEGETSFKDLILGNISVENNELDDFILLRSDGSPTYNLTVVVDDLDQRITHVLRGMDHVSNTPKQILIYDALGEKTPEFAHLPMILGSDKKKLSKRHGATSVFAYRDEGYLTDAFVNYLARLGWSHGDQEIFSRAELEDLFSLDKVSKSDSVFDFDKLKWVNAEHIKTTSLQEITNCLQELTEGDLPDNSEPLIEHLQTRVKTLVEINSQIQFLSDDFSLPEPDKKAFSAEAKDAFLDFQTKLGNLDELSEENIENCFKECLENHSIGFGKLGKPVRFALTGSSQGLAIPLIVRALGKEKVNKRMVAALNFFSDN